MWIPTESDLEWSRNLLRVIKDGGTWACDAGIYRIDHANKKLVRVLKSSLMGGEADEDMARQIAVAFPKVGYEVEDELR